MDITCDKCQTVSSIPDAAIPDEGIHFECPHCSTQLFAKLGNSEPMEDLFGGGSSLSLDTNIEIEDDLNSLNALDDLNLSDNTSSLDIDMRELGDDDISPSMLYNTEQVLGQDKKLELDKKIIPLTQNNTKKEPPTFKEKKNINITHQPEQNAPIVSNNTLDSYLSSRSASVQEQKSHVSPILIMVMALFILGGSGGYYYFFMKNKNLKEQMIMTPELKNIIVLDKDNPSDYKKAFDSINNKLASNSNHVLYKAIYVYIASKYFISIENIIKPFAPDTDAYYNDIVKFAQKSKFINKAITFYDLSKELDQKQEISAKLKRDIQSLPPDDPDSLLLKSYIFYKNNDLERLKKLIDSSNIDKKKMLPVYFVLLKSQFKNNQSISLTLSLIKEINPNHINSIFFNVMYLLNYNQLDEAKESLKKTEALKNLMSDYELTKLYLLEARVYELKLEVKEAYSYVKIAEDLKVENDDFFKEILNFYYNNYYNTAALNMLKNTYKKKYTKDFEISKIYIKLLIRDEDFGKAGQISTELRNKYPRNAESYYVSALLSDSLENTTMAIDFLKKALSINNKYEDAIVLLSKEYIRKDEKKTAKTLLEDSVKDLKENSRITFALALLYFDNKEYIKSKELLDKLLLQKENKISAANINFKINMINLYLKKQTEKETLENLYSIYKKSPNFKELRIEIAKLEIDSKRYNEAIKLLKEELKARENNIEANLYIGIAYYLKKEFTLAEEFLNKTISLDSKMHLAFYYLGKTYTDLNKLNKALDSYSNAYSYDKKNYDYLLSLARTHVALNHANEAFDSYSKLMKINQTFDVLYEYGSLFLKESDTVNALKYFNLSYNINPNNVNLVLEMGNLFFKNTDFKKALIYYQKVIKLDKNNSEAYYKIGETYRSTDKFKKAIGFYLKAIKLNPNKGRYYYQLGYLYKGMKQYKKALSTFRTYLKKIPDSPDKAEIKDEIYDLEHM